MHDPSSRFVIVFNGEIYNFPELKAELKSFGLEFRTKGDTEVVLMAYLYWGQECVKKLNGAFVFAIYDKLKEKSSWHVIEQEKSPYSVATVGPK